MRILIDMDGVLADFEGGFVKEFRKRYPQVPLVPAQGRSEFYIIRKYPHLEESVRQILNSEDFFLNLEAVPGSVEAVQEMTRLDGIEVFICSSPLDEYRHSVVEKYMWVENHLGREWIKKIILTKDKTIINADILIDDRPQVDGVVKEPNWEHVLYDQPYNHMITNKRRLTWNNWREVLLPSLAS
jgi:5'-nucleotidase